MINNELRITNNYKLLIDYKNIIDKNLDNERKISKEFVEDELNMLTPQFCQHDLDSLNETTLEPKILEEIKPELLNELIINNKKILRLRYNLIKLKLNNGESVEEIFKYLMCNKESNYPSKYIFSFFLEISTKDKIDTVEKKIFFIETWARYYI